MGNTNLKTGNTKSVMMILIEELRELENQTKRFE